MVEVKPRTQFRNQTVASDAAVKSKKAMHMKLEQTAELDQLKQLLQHSPIDIVIGLLVVAAVFGLILLVVACQKAPSPERRERWRLDERPRDLWSKYFRGRWWVP